jgi:hypothetical protein
MPPRRSTRLQQIPQLNQSAPLPAFQTPPQPRSRRRNQTSTSLQGTISMQDHVSGVPQEVPVSFLAGGATDADGNAMVTTPVTTVATSRQEVPPSSAIEEDHRLEPNLTSNFDATEAAPEVMEPTLELVQLPMDSELIQNALDPGSAPEDEMVQALLGTTIEAPDSDEGLNTNEGEGTMVTDLGEHHMTQ